MSSHSSVVERPMSVQKVVGSIRARFFPSSVFAQFQIFINNFLNYYNYYSLDVEDMGVDVRSVVE